MLRQETQVSSPVLTGISGFLSSFTRGVRPYLVLRHGTPRSSRVVNGVLSFLFNSEGERGLFLEVQLEIETPPLCCEGILSVPLESVQENNFLSRREGVLGVLSTCCRN